MPKLCCDKCGCFIETDEEQFARLGYDPKIIVRYISEKRWDNRWHVHGVNAGGVLVGTSYASYCTQRAAVETAKALNISRAVS